MHIANQTSFKPHNNANPKGRPKEEWTMKGLIVASLEEADESGTPYKKIIAKKLRNLAAKGDMVAIKEVNNRIDGMPDQPIKHDIEGNINISFHNSLKQDNNE